MHGVAQRIEHAGIVRGNAGIDLPDVRFGDLDILGKSAIGIHADDLYVLADVGLADTTLEAFAAGHMHLGGNEVAFLDGSDVFAYRGDMPAEFVPGNKRRFDAALCPLVPVVDVQI